MRIFEIAPAHGTGGDIGERLGKRTYDYTPDRVFAQLLRVRLSEFRRLVNLGVLPRPCRSTVACDYWFSATVQRVLREVDTGNIWVGRRG